MPGKCKAITQLHHMLLLRFSFESSFHCGGTTVEASKICSELDWLSALLQEDQPSLCKRPPVGVSWENCRKNMGKKESLLF